MEKQNKSFVMIGHSLGINTYNAKLSNKKKDKYLPLKFYRNYYCYGYTQDYRKLNRRQKILENRKIIKTWIQFGCCYFCITEKGINLFKEKFTKEITNIYKPLLKSKERYQRFLEFGDMFDNFLAFCRWDAEPERSWN